MYLTHCQQKHHTCGYGSLGQNGDLGYENKHISILGQHFVNSLSMHAKAQITYDVSQYKWMTVGCAINDSGFESCSFTVLDDMDEVIAYAGNVAAKSGIVWLEIDLTHVNQITMLVDARHLHGAHGVWVEPQVFDSKPDNIMNFVCDQSISLQHVISSPADTVLCTWCSNSKAAMLHKTLESFYQFNNGSDTPLIIYHNEITSNIQKEFKKYQPVWAEVTGNSQLNHAKFMSHYLCRAKSYFMCDPGTLFFDDVMHLSSTVNSLSDTCLLAPAPDNSHILHDIINEYIPYKEQYIMGINSKNTTALEYRQDFVIGTKKALMALESSVKLWQGKYVKWRQKSGECGDLLLTLYHCKNPFVQILNPKYGCYAHKHEDLSIQLVNKKIYALLNNQAQSVVIFDNKHMNALQSKYDPNLDFQPNNKHMWGGITL